MKKILLGIFALFMSTAIICGCYFVVDSFLPASVSEEVSSLNETSGAWGEGDNVDKNPKDRNLEDGSEEKPYLISTPEQFARFTVWSTYPSYSPTYENQGYFKLTNDIDMSAHYWWQGCIKFRGHLDGNGHTISGIKMDYLDEQYEWGTLGISSPGYIFGDVIYGSIKNVTFADCVVNFRTAFSVYSGNIELGLVAREVYGGTIENVKVENCKYNVSFGEESAYVISVGMIAGKVKDGGKIINCIVDEDCKIECIDDVPLKDKDGNVISNLDYVFIGGVAGIADGDFTIKNNYYYGVIRIFRSDIVSEDIKIQNLAVGGIIGYVYARYYESEGKDTYEKYVSHNVFSGSIILLNNFLGSKGEKSGIGGIVGAVRFEDERANLDVTDCINYGSINIYATLDYTSVGGIVGYGIKKVSADFNLYYLNIYR